MKTTTSRRFITTGMSDNEGKEVVDITSEDKNKTPDTMPVDEKPGMIKNPLKIPPKKNKQEPDYDYEVADDDDYDIK